jgi:DNA-binding transcriptional LysR family regulator
MKQVELFLRARGVSARVEAEVDDAELLRALALAGRGVAALELPTVKDDLAAGRLVRLHTGPSGLRETIWLIGPREEEARPGAQTALRGLLGRFALGRELTADAR